MAFNAQQRKALDFVNSGHNLVLLGSAGTGKTFLVRRMCEVFQEKGRRFALTATTGIASSAYDMKLSPMTIHRWSGIGDGRYEPIEIKRIVANNVKNVHVLDRIRKTEVLVIDECSMMSRRFFDCLQEVCSLKDPSLLFGGIQVVLVGDFLQLPPVPCSRYGEDGAFCFENELYEVAFPHIITLTDVMRQRDHALVKAIQEVSIGQTSEETLSLMKDLARPLPCDDYDDDSDTLKLFSTNDLVDDLNRDQILQFPGPLHQLQTIDTGEKRYLNDILASKSLWLKIGMPVMLIKNLSDSLINGLRGTVYDFHEDGRIIVEFKSVKEMIYIDKFKFEVFDPRKNAIVATREQFPIKPAFAITIHKSQGMTLERAVVDCKGIFKAGQLGVAIGRVRTMDGLRVVNFSERACIKQPPKITNILSQADNTETTETCCNKRIRSTAAPPTSWTVQDITDIEDQYNYNDEQTQNFEDMEDDFNDVIAAIDLDQCENVELPDNVDLRSIYENLKSSKTITPMQIENNSVIQRMSFSKFTNFVKTEYSKLSVLLKKTPSTSTGQIVSKDLGQFYTKVHQHGIALEYRMNCLKLFENESSFTNVHHHICFNISKQVRQYLVSEKAKEVLQSNRQLSNRSMTHASRARVRYIGGYCIAKVRHRFVQRKESSRYSISEKERASYLLSKCACQVLDTLRQHEQDVLASTEEPESLLDIERRQNLNRGLTNISDVLFHFFLKLTEECLGLLVNETLNKSGSDVFQFCQTNILENKKLYEEFVAVCVTFEEKQDSDTSIQDTLDYLTLKVSVFEDIYTAVIKYFLMVIFNQFRKDVLDSFKVEKTMAHRKQVRVSKKKKEKSPQSVTTEKPVPEHTEQPEPVTTEHSQPNISGEPELEEKEQPEPEQTEQQEHLIAVPPEPVPSTSGVNEAMIEDDSALCKVCDSSGSGEWIQCESCDSWLHRSCAGLKHHMKWKRFQRKNARFFCKECQ